MRRKIIWTVAAAACLAGSLLFPASQTRADETMMKFEQNKAIVRDYLDAIVNKSNMSGFDTFFADDVVFNETRNFREQYPARMQAIRSAFPDHHLIVRDQIAEGDKVVTRVTFHGTHSGAFNGIPATGKQVEWSGIAMDRIANGKVVEMWHVQNIAALMQQIATKPPPALPK
ncbi:MAG: ester cyclase [bacterium]|nr:ester cyclase [bacterium]